jgi:hypothetical protein
MGPLRDRLVGHWLVERHIHDLDSAWTGRFDGRAHFAPVPGGLAYREDGVLQMGGLAMNAWQVWRWEFPTEAEAAVFFEDGRPFHRFDPRARRPEASVVFEPDRYDIAYEFAGPDEWLCEWRVEGPRKDYRTVTRYRRVP